MVGATPKPWPRLPGFRSKTEALAGSAPRGFSAGKDAHWGKNPSRQKKDLREHQLVIESIKRRLSSIGLNDFEEGKITLAQACESATHQNPLACQVTCRRPPIRPLSALHPTPAMGGTPRKSALSLVRKLEGSPEDGTRGHGMKFGLQGARRIHRSHSLWKNQARLPSPFTGAGLVEGSVPEQRKSRRIGNFRPCLSNHQENDSFR